MTKRVNRHATIADIEAILAAEGRVKVIGFGEFRVTRTAPKRFHNVKTGKFEQSSGRATVSFKPVASLKEFVDGEA
ncbi:HU family DNA-binding protein [uncultured Maritimibacter sp.]|uniref:HU family DNA-binding protein n=1 Tax=uncultured Maritimibacter sp. TaxID=991866 RepID=UPI00259927F1|nr:HU family DNA-binding protein [uncultured Maritimibacter sp.]